jgi:hypothetical protein
MSLSNDVTYWFPVGASDGSAWRLDIVSLLAVIGESAMQEHAQAMTASWLCCLPRIIPAPQVLIKPTRPTRMPQVNAAVVGVKNGTFVQTLNYFPNIIHPIDDLPPFAFKVYDIKHSPKRVASIRKNVPHAFESNTELGQLEASAGDRFFTAAMATGAESEGVHARKRGTFRNIKRIPTFSNLSKLPPHVPARKSSPLNLLSIFSFVLTCALFGLSVANSDGIACIALVTISLASSIVGFASMWSPQLMKRTSTNANLPRGDVVIRTREGAFIVVKCDENVARELYTGTEECVYTVQNVKIYRSLVAIGTVLLMVSVVFLGNCNFPEQLAIGSSYIALNGLFWAAALVDKKRFWNMELYKIDDVTPSDAQNADKGDSHDLDVEKRPSFTRTMWYAIRETRDIGWVRKSGAAPSTKEWDEWLRKAEQMANAGPEGRKWAAVHARDEMFSHMVSSPVSPVEPNFTIEVKVPADQQVPAVEVKPDDQR